MIPFLRAFVLSVIVINSCKTSLSQVVFDSTNLPIVYINTNWQFIPNEPKITADMGIIDNGYNVTNYVTDPFNSYNGKIGLEKRGSISQLWPQNSYSIETRDTLGFSDNVPLMGMPSENDWILYGPLDDHSLMRNVLSYEIGRQMGYWAPRTKFCEVVMQVIWPDYQGVYVMMEKIKRDKNRVDIAKLDSLENAGDSLTGGYIIAIDRNIWTGDTGFNTVNTPSVFIKYVYPKPEDITIQQKNYIISYVDSFENALLSPDFDNYNAGFRQYAEPNSFIDFFIITELSKNIDAYKRSAYMHKDKFSKGGRLRAGPFWDYNSAWYNIHVCSFDSASGWAYPMTCWVSSAPVPFWWGRMLQDSIFTRDLKCRWLTLRSTVLDTTRLFNEIDSVSNYISAAATRHFTRWNLLGTQQGDADTLKMWLRNRIAWMDANMPGYCWNLSTEEVGDDELQAEVYPNPFSDELIVSGMQSKAEMQLFNVMGKKIGQWSLLTGKNTIAATMLILPSGLVMPNH